MGLVKFRGLMKRADGIAMPSTPPPATGTGGVAQPPAAPPQAGGVATPGGDPMSAFRAKAAKAYAGSGLEEMDAMGAAF